MFILGLGGLFLIVAEMNRADAETRVKLNRVFLYAGCMLTMLLLMLIYEYTDYTLAHSAIYLSRARRWRCRRCSSASREPRAIAGRRRKSRLIYFVLWLLALWLVPFVPARSEAGAGVHEDFAPRAAGVPCVPVCGRSSAGFSARPHGGPQQVVAGGVAGAGFVMVMIAVQWPMGSFLISPLAENRIFGTNYYPYMMRPSDYHFVHEFDVYEKTAMQFWSGMGIAFVGAILSTRAGLAWGDWMRRVKR